MVFPEAVVEEVEAEADELETLETAQLRTSGPQSRLETPRGGFFRLGEPQGIPWCPPRLQDHQGG